jgi:predicted enzyme related to lactoylglutathione lyase
MRGGSNEESHAFAYDRPRLGHCAWNELATADRPGAMRFYGDLFGWKKDGEMDMGPMGPYEFLRRASVDGMFAGVMTKPNDMPVSLWSYYFRVADVDEAVRSTQARGGQIIVDPIEIPGGELTVNAVDPQGAMFAFVGPRK